MDTPHVADGDNEGWGSDADLDGEGNIWINSNLNKTSLHEFSRTDIACRVFALTVSTVLIASTR
jgi:hypothetical protein